MKLGIPGGEAVAAAAAEMMIPLKRIGTPEEAAGAMLMLASPFAAFITGQARAAHMLLGVGPLVTLASCALHTCRLVLPRWREGLQPCAMWPQACASCLPGVHAPPCALASAHACLQAVIVY